MIKDKNEYILNEYETLIIKHNIMLAVGRDRIFLLS